MIRRKPRAIVVGSFADPAGQEWDRDTKAFATALDAIEALGPNNPAYDELAFELGTTPMDLEDYLHRCDPEKAMDALIRVLQVRPGVALKVFPSFHEARTFIALIQQMADRKEKERIRHRGY